MNRFTDYLYATVPSVCLAIPFAQILPDLTFLQGIEKLGIIGILAGGIIFFVMERRSFIAKSTEQLERVESRLCVLETKIANDNDKVIHILGEQLDALREIKNGQRENFGRMWQLTLRSISPHTPEPVGRSPSASMQRPALQGLPDTASEISSRLTYNNDDDSNRVSGNKESVLRPQGGSAED